jgi:hypothetical protein
MREAAGAFEVTWNEANMIAAYRLHCGRFWNRKSFAITGAVFAAIFFLIFVGKSESLDIASLVAASALSLLTAAGFVALLQLANRYGSGAQVRGWARQFDLEGAITRFEFGSEGLKITDRMFGGEMRWSEAKGFVENEEILLIYRSPQFYYYISKRDVPAAELANLRALMQAAGLSQPPSSRPA